MAVHFTLIIFFNGASASIRAIDKAQAVSGDL
jgi:hypothetical protein